MQKKAIGNTFLRAIQALYSDLEARVLINSEMTQPVKITRETRQGCPYSPLLFALYIDPFLKHLAMAQNIPPDSEVQPQE